MRRVRKMIRILREEGLRSLLRRGSRRIFTTRVMLIMERRLDQPDRVPFMPRRPLVVRDLAMADLGLLSPFVSPDKLAEHRLRHLRDHRVLAVLTPDESECLGWSWSSEGPYYEEYDNATFLGGGGTFLNFDGEVVSDLRGRGVAFAAFPHLWNSWRSRGHTRALCAVSDENRPSLKLHSRMGYESIGHYTVHTLLGFVWIVSESDLISPGDETGAH